MRDLIQVEVVGDDLAFVQLGQFDQLEIDFTDTGEIIFHDLDIERRDFLQPLQDVETAAASVALERVGGVGHQLQLPQDELRGHDDAIEETGFGDVRDPAVDDDAGIQNLVAFPRLLLASKDATQRRQVQEISLVRAHDQAHVGHQEHHQDLQETLGVALGNAVADDQREQVSADNSENAADGSADQALEADQAKTPFE